VRIRQSREQNKEGNKITALKIEDILSLSRNSQDRRVLRMGLQNLKRQLDAMRAGFGCKRGRENRLTSEYDKHGIPPPGVGIRA
jgi:hypothetical protein